MAQDGVGGDDVEIEVRDDEMQQVGLSLELQFLAAAALLLYTGMHVGNIL